MGVLCPYFAPIDVASSLTPFTKIISAHPQGRPKNGRGMEPNYDPYWQWTHPYLEVEGVRLVDEQGDAEVWGIPEALTTYIYQFLAKKSFLLLWRVSKGTKMRCQELQGTAF